MHVVHGYHHIDGDIPIKNMGLIPEYQDLIEKWLVKDDWAPHFSELARLTLEAALDHDTVVLTHATDRNVIREHVIQKLIEGGAREDNITIIQLTIDPKGKRGDELAQRFLLRRFEINNIADFELLMFPYFSESTWNISSSEETGRTGGDYNDR